MPVVDVDLTTRRPPETSASPPEQRVIDAVLRCLARWGVAKTTLDDVAREAGCSRATVYRLFPGGKDALLDATVALELRRFYAILDARLREAGSLEDLLVAGLTTAARHLTGHPALQYLLAHEPEVVLPRVSFSHQDEVLRVVSTFAAPYLAPQVGATEAPRAAEWLARIVMSYSLCPAESVDMGDEESVRRLVRTFVLPGLTQSVQQGGRLQ